MPVILGLEAKGMGRSDSGNCSQISTEKMNANHLTGDRSIVSVFLRLILFTSQLSIICDSEVYCARER